VKIVYLDQNKWIELAREHYGRDPTHRLRHVLRALRVMVRRGVACFPLSFAHYIETHRAKDPARRWRLAGFMLGLSEGRTFNTLEAIGRREIDDALYRLFPDRVKVGDFELLGRGCGHAAGFDYQRVVFNAAPPVQAWLESLEDRAVLSGTMPPFGPRESWEQAPRYEGKEPELFHEGLKDWATRAPALEVDLRERLMHANALVDRLEALKAALRQHGIRPDELEALGPATLTAMVESMPSSRVIVHLYRQLSRNPKLRIKPNDLTDWAYVGAAAATCDVVVTEKLLADLLGRDGLSPRAVVLTDLHGLPGTLVG
jgi:hypothetical protein